MVTLGRTFTAGSIYHVFNRGVAKQNIAHDQADNIRFLERLAFYQQSEPPSKFSSIQFEIKDRNEPLLFDVLIYCLMPNHFHLLLQSLVDQGISVGIGKLLNSYTKYFNVRYERVGPVFQGPFKSVPIDNDEQLLQTFRYIALNPFAAKLEKTVGSFQWNGYLDYLKPTSLICETKTIRKLIGTSEQIQSFVNDYADYTQSLSGIKHTIIE